MPEITFHSEIPDIPRKNSVCKWDWLYDAARSLSPYDGGRVALSVKLPNKRDANSGSSCMHNRVGPDNHLKVEPPAGFIFRTCVEPVTKNKEGEYWLHVWIELAK